MRAKQIDMIPVDGGHYCVAHWPGTTTPVLAVHGITSSHMSWPRVVRALSNDLDVYAPDLRGRGASADLPSPYGFQQHVADLIALLDHYDLPSVVYVGHSLGAYIGLELARAAPERLRGLVLVDGGIALPLRAGVSPEEVIKRILGPALKRLDEVYPDRQHYYDFWKAHPAFQDLDGWNDDVQAFADYDLTGTEPVLRSRVNAKAVATDAYGPMDPAMVTRIDELELPTLLLTAPRGLLNQPEPLLPRAAIAEKDRQNKHLTCFEIANTNHYSITMGAGSDAVAARIETFITELE